MPENYLLGPVFIEYTKMDKGTTYRLARESREAILSAHSDALVSEQSIFIGEEHDRVMRHKRGNIPSQIANLLFHLPGPGVFLILLRKPVRLL